LAQRAFLWERRLECFVEKFWERLPDERPEQADFLSREKDVVEEVWVLKRT